jgi:hypothetical protein
MAMTMSKHVGLAIALGILLTGCDSPRPNLSEQQVDELLSMPADATAASRGLIEHDAKSREALISLHSDVQTELAEIGRRQDQLEQDRRSLAAQRRNDPIIATTIETVGLIAACLLPLVVLAILLRPRQPEPQTDAVCDYLVDEVLSSSEPARLGNRSSPKKLLPEKPTKSK